MNKSKISFTNPTVHSFLIAAPSPLLKQTASKQTLVLEHSLNLKQTNTTQKITITTQHISDVHNKFLLFHSKYTFRPKYPLGKNHVWTQK